MRNSTIGIVIVIIVLFMSLIVLPIYMTSIVDWRDDMNIAQTAARNFVDKVIDTKIVGEGTLNDLNLALASSTCTWEYTIWREAKVVNPSSNPSINYTTWQQVEVTSATRWETGDIVTIEIRQTSQGIFQRLAAGFFNVVYTNRSVRLSGMVR